MDQVESWLAQAGLDSLYLRQKEAAWSLLPEGLQVSLLKGIVGMPTGSRKTRVVSAFLLAIAIKGGLFSPGDAVLFLAPRVRLRRQAYQEFHASRLRETSFFRRARARSQQ